MKESFGEILRLYFKGLVPFLLTLFFILLNFIPTHLPLAHFFRPDVAMVCVYFWVLYRPDLFGLMSIIVLGIAVDTLSGLPFGVHLFVFLIAYLLTIIYGRYVYAKSFSISWFGFVLVLAGSLVSKWLLLSIYYKTFLLFSHIILTFIVTILIYPFIAYLNIVIQNKYLSFDGEIHE